MLGIRREECEHLISKSFRESDRLNSGLVEWDTFIAILKKLPFGVKHEDLHAIVSYASVVPAAEAPEGVAQVRWKEFVPKSYDVFVHLAREHTMKGAIENAERGTVTADEVRTLAQGIVRYATLLKVPASAAPPAYVGNEVDVQRDGEMEVQRPTEVKKSKWDRHANTNNGPCYAELVIARQADAIDDTAGKPTMRAPFGGAGGGAVDLHVEDKRHSSGEVLHDRWSSPEGVGIVGGDGGALDWGLAAFDEVVHALGFSPSRGRLEVEMRWADPPPDEDADGAWVTVQGKLLPPGDGATDAQEYTAVLDAIAPGWQTDDPTDIEQQVFRKLAGEREHLTADSAEFSSLLARVGEASPTDERRRAMFALVDRDGDGAISVTDFVCWFRSGAGLETVTRNPMVLPTRHVRVPLLAALDDETMVRWAAGVVRTAKIEWSGGESTLRLARE